MITDVMMRLGPYVFSVSTAAYQALNRTTEYRWGAQERIGQREALQFVGPGKDVISLPGVIYPKYRGGFGQLNEMRSLAATGQPLLMVAGTGRLLGRWCIESITETQSVFLGAGLPRKQAFTLKLRKYDDGASLQLPGR
ncbi:phage tail protein [Halomonas sp. MMSF_3323]|uniref:phage tail protein n=1 Tax=Halomonas sp. MMSF_3323 TaxID=3046701 RepID=UPI00273FE08C|nr:phage tail protein [Halomonas sp. MMSF_3323]